MHPDAAFCTDDRTQLKALVTKIALGVVFMTTSKGPRVAHVPLVWAGDGLVQFHLARGNALDKQGKAALASLMCGLAT